MNCYVRATQLSELTKQLTEAGVSLVGAHALGVALSESAVKTLQQIWDHLPSDPHLPVSPTTRRRRHARFSFDRTTSELCRLPDGHYFQSKEVNRLFGGGERNFGPIEARDLIDNPVIESVISKCAAALPVRHERLLINCHLMRIIGLPEAPGEPSPEGIHRDGFEYVSLHFINRTNMLGGQSLVVSQDLRIIAAPMLENPLDTLVMDDQKYLHAGLPFFVSDGIGYRDMMLCSYEVHSKDSDIPERTY